MARPKKDAAQLRTKPLNCYPTNDEKSIIEAAAGLRELTVSRYILACCLNRSAPPATRTNRRADMIAGFQDVAQALLALANSHVACCGPFDRFKVLAALWSIERRMADLSGIRSLPKIGPADQSGGEISDQQSDDNGNDPVGLD